MADDKANNQGMLRQGELRNARQSVDTGTGEKRMDAQRMEHIGRGDFMNFYDDLGFSASQEGAERIREDEKGFQSGMKESRGLISDAQKQVDKDNAALAEAAASVPDFNSALNDGWKDATSDWHQIIVGSPDGIEGTYKLPAQTVPDLMGMGFEVVKISDHRWGVSPVIDGKVVGNTLHSTLNNTYNGLYNGYVKDATPLIQKNLAASNEQLAGYRTNIEASQGEVDAATSVLQGQQTSRDKMWSDARGDYQKKLDTMDAIFNKFEVEKGGPGYERS